MNIMHFKQLQRDSQRISGAACWSNVHRIKDGKCRRISGKACWSVTKRIDEKRTCPSFGNHSLSTGVGWKTAAAAQLFTCTCWRRAYLEIGGLMRIPKLSHASFVHTYLYIILHHPRTCSWEWKLGLKAWNGIKLGIALGFDLRISSEGISSGYHRFPVGSPVRSGFVEQSI